jgi:hypothetical protein
MPAAVAFATQSATNVADSEAGFTASFAVERNDRRLMVAGQRRTTLTCRDLGAALAVRHAGNQRRSAPRSILAGVETVAAQGVGYLRDQSTAKLKVGTESATALSARAKGSGNTLPRFSARRKIPAQAFGLK